MKKILFREIECYVCEARVPKEERIEGYNYYGIRHDDESLGTPVTIEAGVMVNFWGTLATKEDLSKHKDAESWGPNSGWFIEIKDSDDEGTSEEEDETHLFYAAATYNTSINEEDEPIN